MSKNNKAHSSTNSSGLESIGTALASLVDMKRNDSAIPAQQLPKHIQFKRVYDGGRPDFEFTADVVDINATLGSFLSASSLGDLKHKNVWDLGAFLLSDKDNKWEIQILIKLTNDKYFYFTWEDAKKKTISNLAADQNVSRPLQCIIKVMEKMQMSNNYFDA